MMKRIPTRMDVTFANGEFVTMDIGQSAIVTILVKGPFVDLRLDQVRAIDVQYKSYESEENNE
jgi:hypothetical protein